MKEMGKKEEGISKRYMRVLIDTREQTPWLFIHYPDVIVIKRKLDVGDYTLLDKEPNILYPIVIEKKTLPDFISCCGQQRTRFEEELKRMTQNLRYLIINGSLDDIYFGNYRSRIIPLSVRRTIWDWSIEYSLIPVFVSSEAMGQQVAYDIFKMFLHNLEKNGEEKTYKRNL